MYRFDPSFLRNSHKNSARHLRTYTSRFSLAASFAASQVMFFVSSVVLMLLFFSDLLDLIGELLFSMESA